jgi:hypothetical protein
MTLLATSCVVRDVWQSRQRSFKLECSFEPRRATVPSVSYDTDKPFPRIGRKPRPALAAQIARRRARDALDRRVGEAAGAVTPGVRDRASGRRRPRDDSFGARLRDRLRPSAGSNRWRV